MRTNTPNTLKKLIDHPFSKRILKDSIEIKNELYENHIKIDDAPKRLPNKLEYYKLDVGFHISQLFSWCQQLVNNVYFLRAKSPHSTLNKYKITSYDLLIYHIENYYIRVQSMYDRLLNITNALFFLGNSPENVTHKIIIENIFVKQAKLDTDLKKINKIIRDYLGAKRNQIIHQEGYQDQKIRDLEFYCLFLDGINIPDEDVEAKKYIPMEVKAIASEITNEKFEEFTVFNDKIFSEMNSLFSKYEKIYDNKINEFS
ncbi:MAG TPA: Cthe_2314 family HEPN domain-containing protein [Melioribacteraceae bacterium]|nr:Cthe_2314 family HEPN domain-containing protein [Melioribacteraceae bacterium]